MRLSFDTKDSSTRGIGMGSLGRSQFSIGYEKPAPNSASGTRRSEAGPFILIKPGEELFLAMVYQQ